MTANRFVATAALIAGALFVHSAAAQQSMYRCGNKYQDKPCEGGEKGRVVGTTGTPKPAAPAAGSEKAAERERADALGRNARASIDASNCVRLEKQYVRETSHLQKPRQEYDMRQLGCAHFGLSGPDEERKCANAQSEEQRAVACAAYEETKLNRRKR